MAGTELGTLAQSMAGTELGTLAQSMVGTELGTLVQSMAGTELQTLISNVDQDPVVEPLQVYSIYCISFHFFISKVRTLLVLNTINYYKAHDTV
jgi:hypothetical protein